MREEVGEEPSKDVLVPVVDGDVEFVEGGGEEPVIREGKTESKGSVVGLVRSNEKLTVRFFDLVEG